MFKPPSLIECAVSDFLKDMRSDEGINERFFNERHNGELDELENDIIEKVERYIIILRGGE